MYNLNTSKMASSASCFFLFTTHTHSPPLNPSLEDGYQGETRIE